MVHEYLSPTWSFFVTSLISLFIIIDPLGNLFAFLALSGEYPPSAGKKLAWRACLFSFIILTLFVLIGRFIIDFFGISLPAFQIAGGLILFRIAFDMLQGRGHFNRLDTSSSLVATDYRDVALVPLAVPLLAGPGAITAILVLTSRSSGHLEDGLIVLAEAIILFLAYLGFLFAEKLLVLLRESSIRLFTRIMGLILAALAVEFVIQGLRAAFPHLHQ
jgi:multiple antibiotic resistance protein